jgi:hypothetical protein
MGNVTGTTAVNVVAGTGGVTITSTGTGNVNINNTGSSSTVIGNTAGTLTLVGVSSSSLDSTGTLNIGGGATAINIGNIAGASLVTIKAGTGGIAFTGNITQTGAGTFSTGSGAVSLNGATTVTGTNTFATGSGAVSLNGNTTLASGMALTAAGGASNFDFSASSGTFKTGSGAISLNGNTTVTGTNTLSVASIPTGIVISTGGLIGSETIVPVANGGTGLSTVPADSVLAANTLNTVSAISPIGGTLTVLQSSALNAISWVGTTGTGTNEGAEAKWPPPLFITLTADRSL